jgi:hypothetical protein
VFEGVVAHAHHPHDQWTFVLEGQMEFTLDGEKQLLLPAWGIPIHGRMGRVLLQSTMCLRREDYRKLRDTGWDVDIGSVDPILILHRFSGKNA